MDSQKLAEAPAECDRPANSAKDKEQALLPFLKPRSKRTAADHLSSYAMEFLAISFWIYTLIKIFVFDFDILILNRFLPSYEWLLNFKLIFMLAFSCVVWLLIGTRNSITWLIYTKLI